MTRQDLRELVSSLANLPLEYVEAMRLDLDEVVLRQRRVGAWPRGVIMHVVGNARRTAREQENAVGEIDRLLEVVRDEHRRRARFHEDALERVAHEQRHLVVEGRERLVEKKDLRFHHERSHDRDELLLAARQLIGVTVEVDLDAEAGDHPLRARAPFGLRQLHKLERILDVVDRAQPGKQRLAIILEYVAELDVAKGFSVEQDFAAVGRDQAGDHVDQRTLAAAVRSEDRNELSARNVEVEAVVDDRVGKMLGQAADGDVGGCRRLGSRLVRSHHRTLPPQGQSIPQKVCRYLLTSTFSVSVPVCTEKSMNFW